MFILKKSLIYISIIIPILLVGFILGASYIEYDISSRRVEAQKIGLETGLDFELYHHLYDILADFTSAIDHRDSILNTMYTDENDLTNSVFVASISNMLSSYDFLGAMVNKPSNPHKTVNVYSRFNDDLPTVFDFTIFKPQFDILKKKIGISPARAGELSMLFYNSRNLSLLENRPRLKEQDLKDISKILENAAALRSLYADIASAYRVTIRKNHMFNRDLLRSTALQFEYSKNKRIRRFEGIFDGLLLCRDVHKLQPDEPCF